MSLNYTKTGSLSFLLRVFHHLPINQIAERFYRSDFSRTGNDEAVDLCRWVNEPIAVSDECLIVDFVADIPLS